MSERHPMAAWANEPIEVVCEFDDSDVCEWCGDEAHGVTKRDDGYWAPSCGDPACSDDGPYRGAR